MRKLASLSGVLCSWFKVLTFEILSMKLTPKQLKERAELLEMGDLFLKFYPDEEKKQTRKEGREFAKSQKLIIKQRKNRK